MHVAAHYEILQHFCSVVLNHFVSELEKKRLGKLFLVSPKGILKMWKRIFLLSVLNLLAVQHDTEASSLRGSFIENLKSGFKMLGKNDRRLFISHHSYYNRFPSGITDNVANLVAQSFSPVKTSTGKNKNRQDSVFIGEDAESPNNFMGGMLKLLGFDGAKIGAVAVNGIIFIAQMVRYGATKFMDIMMTKTWDWYKIVDNITERIRNETNNGTATEVTRIRF